jgi:2-haloacid dehalogenase
MGMEQVKALTFDTGGTILDWHTGFATALAAAGKRHSVERDWPVMANELRKGALGRMLNLGEHEPPAYNFDGAHRTTLDEVLSAHDMDMLSAEERRTIWWDTVHGLTCWPDFPSVLPRLREQFICASFTILSFRIIIDTARRNGLSWDAVISCEAIGKYKILPESYASAARFLQLDPGEICMVACHNFDLDAARSCGFNTAFVRRPHEWGPAGPPDPEPNPQHDIVVDTFAELAVRLAMAA